MNVNAHRATAAQAIPLEHNSGDGSLAARAQKRRVCFLVRRLGLGGAERQLLELVRGLAERYEISVLTFYAGGEIWEELRECKAVELVALNKRGRWESIGFVRRLIRVLNERSPDIVHGYLPVANILALVSRRFVSSAPAIVWGIRTSNNRHETGDWLARLSFLAERVLCRYADLLIANSRAGSTDFGSAKRVVYVPNGIDSSRLYPDAAARAEIRSEWSVPGSTPLIGLVARIDPKKRHELFLEAAAIYLKQFGNAQFVCVGRGSPLLEVSLKALAERLGIANAIVWAGARSDMRGVYNALDICTLCSSAAEGFPNVLAEAMACGVPCVTTDCGDAALIVGDQGVVIREHTPLELARGWHEALGQEQSALSPVLQRRIATDFSTASLAQRTIEQLERLRSGREANEVMMGRVR